MDGWIYQPVMSSHTALLDEIRCFNGWFCSPSSPTDLPPPPMATHCVCDWLLLDMVFFIYVCNDNFKANLMIVVIMLQTGSPSRVCVYSHTEASAGSKRAHFKGVIYSIVERILQEMWAAVFLSRNFSIFMLCWVLRSIKQLVDYFSFLEWFVLIKTDMDASNWYNWPIWQ